MNQVKLTIDGKEITVPDVLSVRKAALKNGIYVPGLCSHPELNPFKPFNWLESIWQGEKQIEHDSSTEKEDDFPHCDLCLVSINDGSPERACTAKVADGMEIRTKGSDLVTARRESLKKILAHHPHACLTCAQKEGCDRIQCSMDVPVEERCCELLGHCEIGKVAEYIGIPSGTPAYRPEGRPKIDTNPLFIRDYELCINCLRCVRICRDVREVDTLGAVASQGRVWVGLANCTTFPESDCRYCGACIEVCPTGALRDQPSIEVLVDNQAPCTAHCPLGIDIPGYLELITDGKDVEALELIREQAVLPGVLGYACFHGCEDACRRSALNEPVAICALKRYVSDVAGDKPLEIDKAPSTGKRIAIVGSGPAGLAAAVDMIKCGHEVTIFERDNKLGGMLTQAIPNFRLPQEVVDQDIEHILNLGLKTKLGVEIGNDYTPGQLLNDGFDAVVIAVGLSEALNLNVEGEELNGVEFGLDFLHRANLGEIEQLNGSVIIIGGGSVAVDTAMTARRLGSAKVTMICLESPDEIPAHKDELSAALEEGIEIRHRWGVLHIDGQDSKVKDVVLKRCVRVFDDQERFAPEYDDTKTTTMPVDTLIVSIGQRTPSHLKDVLTDKPGIFQAGDILTGPTSIVDAMAHGRKIAAKVCTYLDGTSPSQASAERRVGSPSLGVIPDFYNRKGQRPERLNPDVRVQSLEPYERTFSCEQAITEAERCLRCHLRAEIAKSPMPPDPWHKFTLELIEEIPAVEGVIILADESKRPVKIAGSSDLKASFTEIIEDEIEADFCRWELDPMYTKRESELIQAHLQAFGELPGEDEMDDLF
ncbi:MAG: FAD-dependent oxidoreductase [Candidatus Hatepunaea meridiana]|nr:FAD-dependent oxidoreductase [Candidatus Hatepunaea meridiana]